jgi:glycolate oxidase FAD binding subunit
LIEPSTAAEMAALLARATREKLRVSVQGSGTKLDWGPPRPPADIEISTAGMHAVVAHRHGDLTATIQAGATLAVANRELARHGQWIPLDPPFRDRATVGGIVATNDSGPRRLRYGAPRDLIIGVDLVRADGVAAKAGGIVVKNVAGYDVSRLMTGSFGSLAVVTSATFKLFPIPPVSRTVILEAPIERLTAIASAIAAGQLTPTAIEIATSPVRLLARFESIEPAAVQQAADVVRLAAGASASTLAGVEEASVWESHDASIWNAPGAVVKATVMPTEVGPVLAWMSESLRDVEWNAVGRASLGILFVRVHANVSVQARLVNELRSRCAQGRGSAVIVRGSDDLKAAADVWGPIGDTLGVMKAIKKQFDPDGILPACF